MPLPFQPLTTWSEPTPHLFQPLTTRPINHCPTYLSLPNLNQCPSCFNLSLPDRNQRPTRFNLSLPDPIQCHSRCNFSLPDLNQCPSCFNLSLPDPNQRPSRVNLSLPNPNQCSSRFNLIKCTWPEPTALLFQRLTTWPEPMPLLFQPPTTWPEPGFVFCTIMVQSARQKWGLPRTHKRSIGPRCDAVPCCVACPSIRGRKCKRNMSPRCNRALLFVALHFRQSGFQVSQLRQTDRNNMCIKLYNVYKTQLVILNDACEHQCTHFCTDRIVTRSKLNQQQSIQFTCECKCSCLLHSGFDRVKTRMAWNSHVWA